ncbi:hypothetical protein BDQ17DRAFT_1546989 [Cyathus striatus]|nr:hypothetical protein BDQ17DRAFT_1546989 [Cyathus striatus]
MNPLKKEFAIAAREMCMSCSSPSGPTFFFTNLRGPSEAHRSNIVPTGQERELVLSNISYAQSEISRLDEEIPHLKKSLEILQQRRDALLQFEFQEQSLLAPIRKVSEDILRYIFLQLQLDSVDGIFISYSSEPSIRNIIQVSAYWRSIAESYAELWSRVSFDVSYYTKLQERNNVEHFLEKCILLSGESPISIYFRSLYIDDLSTYCIQAIAGCSHRWKEISASGAAFEVIAPYIPPDTPFSCLTSLIFTDLDDLKSPVSLNPAPQLISLAVRDVFNPIFHISIPSMPSLTHMSFNYICNPSTVIKNLPWSQITQFTSYENGFMDEELPCILKCMSKLTTLNLRGPLMTSEVIILPHLERLTLHHNVIDDALEKFVTPLFQTLKLKAPADISRILRFIGRSGCSLIELKVTCTSLNEEWNVEELKTLKKLHMHVPLPFTETIHYIARRDGEQLLLFPQLEVLKLKDVTIDEGTKVADNLVSMLKSRLPSNLQDQWQFREALSPTEGNEERTQFLQSVTVSSFDQLLYDDSEVDFMKTFLQSDALRQHRVHVIIKDKYNFLTL